jgi:hypothetical protein
VSTSVAITAGDIALMVLPSLIVGERAFDSIRRQGRHSTLLVTRPLVTVFCE